MGKNNSKHLDPRKKKAAKRLTPEEIKELEEKTYCE